MAYELRTLNLSPSDMIDPPDLQALNARLAALMTERGINADDAIDAVLVEQQAVLVDETNPRDTDGGHVQLWRLPGGVYVTVWRVSAFAAARWLEDVAELDGAGIGFDDQALGWA